MIKLNKLFSKSKDPSSKAVRKSDNKGTCYRDEQHAQTIWTMNHMLSYTPVVICRFDTLDAARKAVLNLSYIHEVTDTKELITSEPLEFGCYRNAQGQGEVIICGQALTREQWQEAKDTLTSAGGTVYKEQEPREETKKPAPKASAKANACKFVRKEQNGMNTYEIYRGASRAAATEFLQAHPVNKPLYYIVVETPEGNFGRDKDGIYQEP